ncbi:MAG: type II secretion system protein GspN, partial [Thermodesulfobacteriota bacterium]
MERPFLKLTAALGLALFGLVAAALAAHYQFPYRKAARLIKERLESSGPVRLDFEGPFPGRPFVCRLDRVRVGLAGPGGTIEVFRFDQVRLGLKPWSLAAGRLALSFNPEGGGDRAEGLASLRLFGVEDLRLEVRDLDLPGFVLIDPLSQARLAGRLTGGFTITARDGFIPGDGEGSFRLGPGRVEGLHLPQVPLTGLDFDRADFVFKIQGGQV